MSSIAKLIQSKRVPMGACGELKDKTVSVSRVAKVVSGGRRFSFSALVVTGDGQGHIGFGLGKAAEVPEAIRKASDAAKKNIVKVPLKGLTIPHDIIGTYGSSKVVLKPARPGTGVIAGSSVRAIVELAGIQDIRTKCIGSNSAQNILQATLNGLLNLDEPEDIASLRGKSIEELGYEAY